MESKKPSNRPILILIALGIWAIVIQNTGLFPSGQKVEIINSVAVHGEVEVNGKVNIDNTVDINIERINGHKSFYDHNYDGKYNRIPVYGGN